ncbi:MAG: hypothetical protein ACOX8U_02855 [Bradymonadia bacterium]|jgi:hypothetical protein
MMIFRNKIFVLPLFFLCACLLSACGWDESIVNFTGERCPPVSDGADQPPKLMSERCKLDSKGCHYHSELRRCEANYKCVPDPSDDSGMTYECNNACPDAQKLCPVDGASSVCANTQTDAKHCGKCNNACPAGTACDEGKCGCSKIKLTCDGQCIEPKSERQYCGAKLGGRCSSDDPNSPDYKGRACSSAEICQNGECVCDENGVLCNGSCIDPKNSNQHCGAKGNCIGNESTANDFAGVVCETGKSCLAGVCACPSGFVLCDGNCIDPLLDHNYCGAKGACTNSDASHADYKGMQCAERSACIAGICKVVSCEEGLQLCSSGVDGGNICIDVMGNDPNNCGSCGWKCIDHPMNGATSETCLEGKCMYTCPLNTTNCALDEFKNTEPLCLSEADRKDDPKHCGTTATAPCGVVCDDESPVCYRGMCDNSTCQDAEGKPTALCMTKGCMNFDSSCGRRCVDCTTLPNIYVDKSAGGAAKCVVDAASAAEGDTVGSCKISRCADGYHLNRKTSGNACVRNRVDKCAHPDQAEDGDNTDCRKIEGVALSACNPKGYCDALRCETNYRLVQDNERGVKKCVPNTDSACGAVDSLAFKDCTKNFGVFKYRCRMGVCVFDETSIKSYKENIWCNVYSSPKTPCPYVEGKLRYCTREEGNAFGCGYLCAQETGAEGAHSAVSCGDKCILFGDGASCDLCKNCNDGERCYKDSESGKVLCAACEDACSAPQICTEDKTARFACTGCANKCPAQQCYLNDEGNFACTECEPACPVTQNCYQKDNGNFACTQCSPPCAEGERCYLNEQGKFACTECKESCEAPEHCYFIKAKAESFVCR